MGSIYIYDVGTAPFRAPWALYRGSEDIGGLRDDLLAIVDEPEFVDTESNILRDAQGSDEYDLYRDLVDRKIDYFLIATGGSMDQLVAVRSKDDFRRFIDHMDDHYAADVYVGEDEDRRLIRASSGKFIYHNSARSNPSDPPAEFSSGRYTSLYHATPHEMESLDRNAEIYLAPDMEAARLSSPHASSIKYVYEVIVPENLRIFEPSSVFRDLEEAKYVARTIEDSRQSYGDGVLDNSDMLDAYIANYFLETSSYTADGVEVMDNCGIWRHGVFEIYQTFLMGLPNERVLDKSGRCLKDLGYDGRFEQELDFDFDSEGFEVSSLCIFDQRKCRLGSIVWRSELDNPARSNPTDTLVTNPNTGGSTWWYVTDEPNIEFRTGDEAHRFTWFGGDLRDWDDFGLFNLGMKKDYLLEVQIEIPAGCEVFDARTLFSDIPQWVRDSLRKSTQIDAEELESDEGYEFIDNYRCMAIDRDTYRYFQNMRIEDPSLKALCSTFDSEGRTEFLIKLWLLDWSTVQAFLMESSFTEESGRPIVGWYEIERIDYNYHTAINLGLYMGAPASSASRKQGCSDIRVRIIKAISAKQR